MLTEEIAMFVTPLYAGLLTLWFTLLSVRVMNLRRRGIAFGDGGDIGVTPIIRAQANFAEYVPLALLLMGFLEDEIQMGFYRTGKMWAMEHFDVQPDIIVFG